MYTRILNVTLAALFSGVRALWLPVSTLEYQLPSSSTRNLTSNSTSNPLTFLGVNCYYLQPDTVNLLMCQDAFADMYRSHVHDEMNLYSGWFFGTQHPPCTIKLANTSKKERHDRVSISMADIVSYATEVLEECRSTGTGGANTFKGNWQVVVTRDPIKDPIPNDGLDQQ